MQRYLRPDLLDARRRSTDFDAWAATFGAGRHRPRAGPRRRRGFRMKTRFAQFLNVPELLRMWHSSPT